MKAITVQQPWAWAIAVGAKTVENRSWSTTYRGPLAIHAGKRWSTRGGGDERIVGLAARRDEGLELVLQLPTRSAIVALCELEDVHPDAGCCRPWGESSYATTTKRRGLHAWQVTTVHHWQLAEIRPIVPIPCAGRLGLWTPAEDLLEQMSEALT